MKMVKSLLLGTAAGLVAMTGAQAADLPVKAKPVQYVKICSLYGAGFYYIPGTDTCIKIGGFVRAEVNFNAGGSFAPAVREPRCSYLQQPALAYPRRHHRRRPLADRIWHPARLRLSSRPPSTTAALTSGDNTGNGTGAWPIPVSMLRLASSSSPASPLVRPVRSSTSTVSLIRTSRTSGRFGQRRQRRRSVRLHRAARQRSVGLDRGGKQQRPSYLRHLRWLDRYLPRTVVLAAQSMPDIVGNLRIDQAWGSAQIMGAAHQVNYGTRRPRVPSDKYGYAVGAGLKVNLPMIGKGDYIIGQFTYGKGAIDYVGSGLGQRPDRQAGRHDVARSGLGRGRDRRDYCRSDHRLERHRRLRAQLVPGWKSSLYGSYGKLEYSTAASAALAGCVRLARPRFGQLVVLAGRFAHGLDPGPEPRSERRSDVSEREHRVHRRGPLATTTGGRACSAPSVTSIPDRLIKVSYLKPPAGNRRGFFVKCHRLHSDRTPYRNVMSAQSQHGSPDLGLFGLSGAPLPRN